MPRSPSPPRGPRRRSPSPKRDRDRDDRGGRPRSRSPRRHSGPRRVKELSFYKKGGPSMGSLSHRRDPLEEAPETEKERLERRDRGEVPARFGGTRQHGLRNTMATIGPVGTAPIGIGNPRKAADPLDNLGVRGEEGGPPPRRDEGYGRQKDYERERYEREKRDRDRDRHRSERSDRRDGDRRDGERKDGDKQREERMAAMDKPQQAAPAAAAARAPRFITVIANDRMGRKVEIKCLPTDTVGDLKKLIAAQIGTSAQKIILKKWYTAYKDHVTLGDYEINDGMSLEMY